jgi:hypothetical protein
MILQFTEGIGLPVVVGILPVSKNIIASAELWVEGDSEMKAVEVKGMDPKYTW